ncbi:MAG TPA: hypothetical protein DCE08_05645 [Ruminococcaceae bacterium]|nr:hypothetical protein [Oscillospiraceae bacterium]
MISRFIGEMLEKYGLWFFIVLTFVSGLILANLPQKYRPKLESLSPFIFEGCLSFLALVLCGLFFDTATVFKLCLIANFALFAFIHTRKGIKRGDNTAVAIIMGVILSALGLFGGIFYLLALGKASQSRNAGTRSTNISEDGSYNGYVAPSQGYNGTDRNEQAEVYASKLGFSSADEAENAGIDTGKYHE